jgi:hypothetical protein
MSFIAEFNRGMDNDIKPVRWIVGFLVFAVFCFISMPLALAIATFGVPLLGLSQVRSAK